MAGVNTAQVAPCNEGSRQVQYRVGSQALRLLHAQPEHPWTVEELADAVAVARSTLAQRFSMVLGETPMRYLAAWRIQLAKHLLRQTNLRVGEIAARVGFDSDAAFNRAFKRHVGHPPAAWRMTGGDPSPATASTVATAAVADSLVG